MIFVTIGSQKFQFDRLLKKIDHLIESGVIQEAVMAQIGASNYVPKHYSYVRFMDREKFSETMEQCDIVITHGGTGVIISAVKKGKKVIAVPRLAIYGEHVDDHQLQLIQQFEELDIIEPCYEVECLGESYIGIRERDFHTYVSNTNQVIGAIEEYLSSLQGCD